MKGALRCLPSAVAAGPVPPAAENLSYSMPLPGGAYCAGLARQAVRSLLTRQGLAGLCDTAALAASELVAAAYWFTPDREVIPRVRRQFDALRIVLYDQHPAHASAEKAEECRDRRSRSMWLPAAAVDTHGGDWGLAPVLTPGGGTKSWALLHR
ncbi:ATP-binding protein [Streptomyces vilmorinianum]|uniref:ATP-binding protein n=1 Tax=Streptomyces vilmorinianum TaxID=3051092 RepID=UPI0010FB2E15|nr:ATP-binding protein [Streptomyces vilmorinianum]